jgi:transposase
MLNTQGKLNLGQYSDLYDLIVPKDNLFRQLKELCGDFEFIYDELKDKYCPDNGRAAIDPRVLFKYLLIKVIDNWSDVDVVEHSRYDMSYKCFLGLPPEQSVMIDPSSLTVFRRRRLQDPDLMDKLISQSLRVAAEHGLIKSKTIILDSTHTRSRANKHFPSEYLQKLGKDLRKSLYGFDASVKKDLPEKYEGKDLEKALSYAEALVKKVSELPLSRLPAVSKRLNLLKETIDDIQDHYESSVDPDARTGHKSEDDEFFGYKTHMAINQERLVTAAVVTSGEASDGDYMQELIDRSRSNGQEVEEAIGDGAYCSNDNLEESAEKGVKVIAKLNANVAQGLHKEDDGFSFNKDAGLYVCPAGHMATRKAVVKGKGKKAVREVHYFDVHKCVFCKRREGCFAFNQAVKTYSVAIHSEAQEKQLAFQQTEEFREKYRERYKIEAKNADLKNNLGYDRAESYGIGCMALQGAVTIYAANLRRIVRLLAEKAGK